MAALDGIRILDLTRLLPGPAASHWMRQKGAEVIKVEAPGEGDPMRAMNPRTLFHLVNQGKKSVALNLKSAAGREAFARLVQTADVVLEGFRPGVMERLECGYEQVGHQNLVWVSITGYGRESKYSQLAGHDINYLAMAGVLDLIGTAGGAPVIPGVQIADIAAGSMQAVNAVLAALLERTRTGRGQRIDVSMTHGSTLLLPFPLAEFSANARPPERGRELLSGRYACYNVYRARDGRYLAVGALEPKFWKALCEGLGCGELVADQFADDPRRSEVIAAIAGRFAERSAREWFDELRHVDACVTPVLTVEEAAHEWGLETKAATPGPALGEHNQEILGALGYRAADIALFDK